MAVLWLALSYAISTAPGGGAVMICQSMGAIKKVRPTLVSQNREAAKDLLKKRGLHILDLSASARLRRTRLERDITPATLCAMYEDLERLFAIIKSTTVDFAFVAEKLQRVQGLLGSAGLPDADKARADKLLLEARASMNPSRFARANTKLNQVLAVLVGSEDPWTLPPAPAEAPVEAAPAEPPPLPVAVEDQEIAAACPALAAKEDATAAELEGVRAQLVALMNKRKLRASDAKEGRELTVALAQYATQPSLWPAARLGCALLARLQRLEIGLSFVARRFQEVRRLRAARGLDDAQADAFGELVREASEHNAKSRFAEAHQALERLVVFLGEPETPAATLTPPAPAAAPAPSPAATSAPLPPGPPAPELAPTPAPEPPSPAAAPPALDPTAATPAPPADAALPALPPLPP